MKYLLLGLVVFLADEAIACQPDLVDTPGFPEGSFADLKCAYIACIREYKWMFEDAPNDFDGNKLNSAENKADVAINKMEDLGDVLVSVDRMGQSIKWMGRYRGKAKREGRYDAKHYANEMGAFGSDCTVDLLEDMIDALENSSGFLAPADLVEPKEKLHEAMDFQNRYKWRNAVFRSLWGIRLILTAMGERFICSPCETE